MGEREGDRDGRGREKDEKRDRGSREIEREVWEKETEGFSGRKREKRYINRSGCGRERERER